MHVLIACDSFKDALDAERVCHAIATGLTRAHPGIEVTEMPLSDGGEGVLDILRRALGLKDIVLEVADPLGRPVEPTLYVDISNELERKTAMLACHESQRAWLRAHHGMDEYIDAMQRFAAMRGQQSGAAHAEAFVQHRGHAYPHDDLLKHLLGHL